MGVSFFSFAMSVFWLSVFIVICALFQHNPVFVKRFGIAPVTVLIAFGALRFFAIFELPFAKVITSKVLLTGFRSFMNGTAFEINGLAVTWTTVAIIIWFVVTALFLFRIAIGIIKQKSYIKNLSGNAKDSLQAEMLLNKISDETGTRRGFRVVVSDNIRIPMITGFFVPTVLLPGFELDEEDMENVLRHEWGHHLHRDIWIKLFVNIFCSVFWWNPLVYILRTNLDFILEIHCDSTATKDFNEHERVGYIKSVYKVIKISNENKINVTTNTVALSSTSNSNRLQKRFDIFLSGRRKLSRLAKAVMCVALCALMLLSYAFIIQPEGYPDDLDGEFMVISPENSYILKDGDSYYLYVDGELFFEIQEDSLTYSPLDTLKIIER